MSMARAGLAAFLISLNAAPGALAEPAPDPLIVAGDIEADAGKRVKAIKESLKAAQAGEIDARLWRDSMKKVAWKASNPAKVRIPAIEALVEQDEADSRQMLALLLPREPARPVVDLICDLAVKRGWKDLTPAIVRSYSRFMLVPPDEERSERAALLALHPDRPLADVAFEVFAAPVPPDADEYSLQRRARSDAWTLLARIDPERRRTRELLAAHGGADTDPVMIALHAASADLKAAPAGGEQLDWLLALRKPEHAAFWSAAKEAISRLTPEQSDGLELRHAAPIVWAAERRPEWLAKDRAALLAEATERLKGARTHRRVADTPDGSPPPKESIGAHAPSMVWADALSILIALDAIRDGATVEALFAQVEQDRADKTTEYGGILDASPRGSSGASEGFVATMFQPRAAQRPNDSTFIASPEMLSAGVASLFDYHFHARKMDDGEYAGPSEGDLEFARRFGRACLVLTSLASGVLGVDYYQPDGVVVDLGEIKSGAPAASAKP